MKGPGLAHDFSVDREGLPQLQIHINGDPRQPDPLPFERYVKLDLVEGVLNKIRYYSPSIVKYSCRIRAQ